VGDLSGVDDVAAHEPRLVAAAERHARDAQLWIPLLSQACISRRRLLPPYSGRLQPPPVRTPPATADLARPQKPPLRPPLATTAPAASSHRRSSRIRGGTSIRRPRIRPSQVLESSTCSLRSGWSSPTRPRSCAAVFFDFGEVL
jgi:hypothetical protein